MHHQMYECAIDASVLLLACLAMEKMMMMMVMLLRVVVNEPRGLGRDLSGAKNPECRECFISTSALETNSCLRRRYVARKQIKLQIHMSKTAALENGQAGPTAVQPEEGEQGEETNLWKPDQPGVRMTCRGGGDQVGDPDQ
ncbi:hypothetical protein Q8A73_000881 [Channa argus]|nr:hypothetical protein Q8A73_000881 [Channa argus]